MEAEIYKEYIGRTCTKKSPKQFKSSAKINTIKGIINHPHLNVPAYIFHEDDSYVECRKVQILD